MWQLPSCAKLWFRFLMIDCQYKIKPERSIQCVMYNHRFVVQLTFNRILISSDWYFETVRYPEIQWIHSIAIFIIVWIFPLHDIEMIFTLMVHCEVHSQVTVWLLSQMVSKASFDVFVSIRNLLKERWSCRWFERPRLSCDTVMHR